MSGDLKVKRYRCGDDVLIANGAIRGTVEEIVHCRGMWEPVYLVQWWRDGDIRSARFSATEMVPA